LRPSISSYVDSLWKDVRWTLRWILHDGDRPLARIEERNLQQSLSDRSCSRASTNRDTPNAAHCSIACCLSRPADTNSRGPNRHGRGDSTICVPVAWVETPKGLSLTQYGLRRDERADRPRWVRSVAAGDSPRAREGDFDWRTRASRAPAALYGANSSGHLYRPSVARDCGGRSSPQVLLQSNSVETPAKDDKGRRGEGGVQVVGEPLLWLWGV
jgi:hypothetical protein